MNCIKIFLIMVSLAQFTAGHLYSGKSSQAWYNSRTNEWNTAAGSNSAHRYLGNTGSIDALNIQLTWWDWNYCTNAFPIKDFAPQDVFVPEGYVFLAGYPTGFKENTTTCNDVITRKGEIGIGKQTVFYPLYNYHTPDSSDDYILQRCGTNTSEQQEEKRFASANTYVDFFNNPNTTKFLVNKIDDVDVTPTGIFLYDNRTNYLTGCADNRTYQQYLELLGVPVGVGDTCDEPQFQKLNGLDVYPMFGWWGNDTREWVDGEQHTYELGVAGPDDCFVVKYILTAKEECVGFCIFLCLRRLLRLLFFWL